MSEDEILEAKMLNYPLTQYMFCSPDEGGGRGHRVPRRHRPPLHRPARARARHQHPHAPLRLVRGVDAVDPGRAHRRRPTVDAAKACFDHGRHRSRRGRTSPRCRTPRPGPRSCTWPRTGSAPTASRSACSHDGDTEIGGRLPINTDGGLIANGEPIGASGLRQVHEIVLQLRGDAGERQVPGDPRVGYTQVYGAPGVGACTLLTR